MTDFQIDKLIKLEGTDYDRRRKLTTNDVAAIKRAHKQGYSISSLAKKYHVSYPTIKYHVDSDFKKYMIEERVKHGFYCCDASKQRVSRIAYKRAILAGKI